MKARVSIALSCLITLVLCTAAEAADGWKMPNLIPFKKKSSSRTTASISDQSSSGVLPKVSMPDLPKVSVPKMKMPKMEMPGWMPGAGKSAPPPKKHSPPSTMDKLQQGTKDFFGKTKQVLMPWSTPKKSSSSRSKKSKSPFLGMSWPWGQEEKQPEVKTIQDFMALDRPKF